MPSCLTTSLHTKAHDRILIDRDITGRYKGAKFCSVYGRGVGEGNNKQRPHPQETEKGKKSEEVKTKHIVANTRSHQHHTTCFRRAVVASHDT